MSDIIRELFDEALSAPKKEKVKGLDVSERVYLQAQARLKKEQELAAKGELTPRAKALKKRREDKKKRKARELELFLKKKRKELAALDAITAKKLKEIARNAALQNSRSRKTGG